MSSEIDWLNVVTILLLAACIAWAVTYFVNTGFATGPGCPADPSWIGYCSDIPSE